MKISGSAGQKASARTKQPDEETVDSIAQGSAQSIQQPKNTDNRSASTHNSSGSGAHAAGGHHAGDNTVAEEELFKQLSTLKLQREDPTQAEFRDERERQIASIEMLLMSSQRASGRQAMEMAQEVNGEGAVNGEGVGDSEQRSHNAAAKDKTVSTELTTGETRVSGVDAGNGTDVEAPDFRNGVSIDGKQITKDGQPHTIKGVAYSAENQGFMLAAGAYADPDSTFEMVNKDFQDIAATGANTVRVYDPFLEAPGAFDVMSRAAEANGLDLLVTLPRNDPQGVAGFVRANQDNKNIVGYTVGNEVNFNNFYGTSSNPIQTSIELSHAIRGADGGNHPIFSSMGEVQSAETLGKLEQEGQFDGHTINYYRDPSTSGSYADPLRWAADQTNKPLILGEYGTDSYDAPAQRDDWNSQATALDMSNNHVGSLITEGTLQGVTAFGWKDQIFRSDGAEGPNVYMAGEGRYDVSPEANLGFEPNPNVGAVDGVQNDEFMGLTDASGNKKPAYEVLTSFYSNM